MEVDSEPLSHTTTNEDVVGNLKTSAMSMIKLGNFSTIVDYTLLRETLIISLHFSYFFKYNEEFLHHTVCECPAIKSIRVRLYGKPLLPEEVMEEPLWKIARFASETRLIN